jgi:hypothetical protein
VIKHKSAEPGVGYQARDVVGGMQVNLLPAKAQSGPAFAKANDLHTQNPGVKFAGALDIRDRENQVIEPFDVHQWTSPLSGLFEIAMIGAMRPAPVAVIAPPVGH